MPGRSFTGESYRFGFNGKEKDDEGMGGGGSTYDYGFRIYNPQLGKFPTTPPQSFLDAHADKSFLDFLRYHNLEGIIGILQYGYEVQGYGTLATIPAFYGLVWITPPIIRAMIKDSFGGKTSIVTAWSKGWGDLWKQIHTMENLNIIEKVTINSINRP